MNLSGDDSNLRHGCLSVCVQQLSAVFDDAIVLLAGAWQETGHIHERHDWDVEAIQETHETRRFHTGVDIKTSCHLAHFENCMQMQLQLTE